MNFAITGIAGYIANRHLKAMQETGNTLLSATDPHDSVGILDTYFPEATFFTEFERFDRHLEMLRRGSPENRVNYLSICSPNHLHDAHIRLALRLGADAICEKPIVLNPWNLNALAELEQETGRRIWSVLQLRIHPRLIELKRRIEQEILTDPNKRYHVDLNYVTPRGKWYDYSWKGKLETSGGIATNIGVHLFDLLLWCFGHARRSEVHLSEPRRTSGYLDLKNADVRWFLSINLNDIPAHVASKGQGTYRSIIVDGEEIEFTSGFTDLHTEIYRNVMSGDGFGLQDSYPSIELVHAIRNAHTKLVVDKELVHPFHHRSYGPSSRQL